MLGVPILHSGDEEVILSQLIILAGEGLSILRGLWTEKHGDRRSLGISDWVFR